MAVLYFLHWKGNHYSLQQVLFLEECFAGFLHCKGTLRGHCLMPSPLESHDIKCCIAFSPLEGLLLMHHVVSFGKASNRELHLVFSMLTFMWFLHPVEYIYSTGCVHVLNWSNYSVITV